MVERSSEPFRAFRIEEDEEGEGPKGRMVDIGLSDLNEGELVVGTHYSNLNYKDALAATGKGKIAWKLPIVGGIDVAGAVEASEDPAFEPGEEVLVTGFGLSEDRDGGYSEVTRLKAGHALKVPEGLDAKRAMAIGTAGLTAALSVARMEHNGLSPEAGSVIVTGATGGVGSLAVDMLAGLGYEVVALTGKAGERGYLEDLGASEVLLRQELEMGGRPLENARVGRGGGHGRRRDARVANPYRQEGRQDRRVRERRRGGIRDHGHALHPKGHRPPRHRLRLVRGRDEARAVAQARGGRRPPSAAPGRGHANHRLRRPAGCLRGVPGGRLQGADGGTHRGRVGFEPGFARRRWSDAIDRRTLC